MKLLFCVALLVSACGVTPAATPAPETDAGAATKTAEVLYACPMHPQVTSTDPAATCTICGMDLMKKEEHDHGGHEH